MGVKNADFAFEQAIKHGVKSAENEEGKLPYPAIFGIGDSLIYFIDRFAPDQGFGEGNFQPCLSRLN